MEKIIEMLKELELLNTKADAAMNKWVFYRGQGEKLEERKAWVNYQELLGEYAEKSVTCAELVSKPCADAIREFEKHLEKAAMAEFDDFMEDVMGVMIIGE